MHSEGLARSHCRFLTNNVSAQQPDDEQEGQTLMPAVMPLLATMTKLERLTYSDCCFHAASAEWLRLAPTTLRRLDIENTYLRSNKTDLAGAVSHLRHMTSLHGSLAGCLVVGFFSAITHCTALRQLAVSRENPHMRPLPKSISRLSNLELLQMKESGVSSLPSSISALRPLRILRVNNLVYLTRMAVRCGCRRRSRR